MARVRGNTDEELKALLARSITPTGPQQRPPRAPPAPRRQPPHPSNAEDPVEKTAETPTVLSPRTAPPHPVAATLDPVCGGGPSIPRSPASRRRVHAPSPLQQQEAASSAAALQTHAEAAWALQQAPYTAEVEGSAGRKRRGDELPYHCNNRASQIGDEYVPTSRHSHSSSPLDPLIQTSVAAFTTHNPRDLDIIRMALLALPKGPASVLHKDGNSVGGDDATGSTLTCIGAEGGSTGSEGASTMSVEVEAYDIVGPDLLRYGFILSKPWRLFWELNALVLHDADILNSAKAPSGQVNLLQRITTILQDHPGPVRCFRIDSCWLDNGTDQLEAWFQLLKVKKVKEVIFVNCKWPNDILEFPINSLGCESLEHIRLCFVKISDICLNYVEKLTLINLACCSISTQDLYALVYQCASLRQLDIGIYESKVIRISSASLEILQIWQTTLKTLEVQNAAKLRRVFIEAEPWRSNLVSAGLKKPSPCVGVWIIDAPILGGACFNLSTQSITINSICTMKDNLPLPTMKILILHICLKDKKAKKAFLNFMRSCVLLTELTLWRDDEAYGDEHSDALFDDWDASLKNLSSLLHLQIFTIKDYKGGAAELAVASAVLGYAPNLQQLNLEANVSDNLIFTAAETTLRQIAPASANALVRFQIGLQDCNSLFSDGG